jgi:hypothetical protein
VIKSGFEVQTFLRLIRALFPRWDFFDSAGYRAVLQVRPVGAEEWQEVHFETERRPANLLFNPFTNFAHLQESLLQQLIGDVSEAAGKNGQIEASQLDDLASFRMVRALAREELIKRDFFSGPFQFRLLARTQHSETVLFVSHQEMMRS